MQELKKLLKGLVVQKIYTLQAVELAIMLQEYQNSCSPILPK